MPKKTTTRKGKTAKKPRLTLASAMDCVNETLRKHNMRLKELEHRSKTTDTNWADAVAAAMKAIADTDRKAASLEALNEVKARLDALEAASKAAVCQPYWGTGTGTASGVLIPSIFTPDAPYGEAERRADGDPLGAANKRIAELEAQLEAVRKALGVGAKQ